MLSQQLFVISFVILVVVILILLVKVVVLKPKSWNTLKYELSCFGLVVVIVGGMFVFNKSDFIGPSTGVVETISVEDAMTGDVDASNMETNVNVADQAEDYEVFYERVHLRIKEAIKDLDSHLSDYEMSDMWTEDFREYSRQLVNWIHAFQDRKEVPEHYDHVHSTYLEGVDEVEAAIEWLHRIFIEFGDESQLVDAQKLLRAGEAKIDDSKRLYDQVEKD